MIDKSLTAPRKKKVKGQLHKLAYITDKEAKLLQKSGGQKVMTPEGVPAYPPPGERGGPGSGSEGRSPGGRDGGGGGAAAQAAASAAAAARSRAAAADAAAKSKRDMQATIAKAEKAEAARVATPISGGESMARFGTPVYAGTNTKVADDMISRGEGQMDAKGKFISQQYIKPRNIYDGTDLEEQKEIDDIRAKRELQSNPNLSRDRQKALEVSLGLRDPKQSSGIGSFLKNAAMAVVPGLLPAKLAMPYKMYRGYKTAKKYVPKIGDIETALKSKLTNNFIGTGDNRVATQNQNKKRTFNEPTRDGNNVQRVSTGKDAVTESIKKYTGISDTRKAEAFKRKSTVENILKQGSYQGKQLTNQQRDQLTKYIAQIEQYLVPVEMAAHGGRIDKPFTGRSRDI